MDFGLFYLRNRFLTPFAFIAREGVFMGKR